MTFSNGPRTRLQKFPVKALIALRISIRERVDYVHLSARKHLEVCIQAVADGSICLSASTEGVSGGDMAICTPSAGQHPARSR
jgi:hypothetical protein